MGAEVRVSPMGDVWTQWEGQVINGLFPLRRCLGISDHSGVFLTEYTAGDIPNAALKLVPLIPTLAESQLSHWAAAAVLRHPNLIRLIDTGRCQLGSQHYLYVVMEHAEQNLAHLLQHRPLTETEVREMLPLTLDALRFLHDQGLVQGQLKPSNILVVGNQLKLASDTIRPADEATASIGTLSLYNPPEARDGSCSTSGDIWALGVTLCQALTTRLPSRSGERSDDLVLPPDLPVSFVSVIRRCLIRNPAIRPNVNYLRDWLNRGSAQQDSTGRESTDYEFSAPEATGSNPVARDSTERDSVVRDLASRDSLERDTTEHDFAGRDLAQLDSRGRGAAERLPAAAATSQPAPPAATKPDINIVAQAAAAPVAPRPEASPDERPGQRSFVPLALAAVVLVAVVWGAVHFLGGRPKALTAATETPGAGSQASAPSVTTTPSANGSPSIAPSPTEPPVTVPSRSTRAPTARSSSSSRASVRSTPSGGGGAESASVVHEELPTVPLRARESIHGHVKVAVLVTVNNSGVVVSDVLDHPGPSRYFAHLATEAARKWKFAPAASPHRWLVHFEFGREGTKVHATPSN
jgi:serine/threonine protein kinase